MGTFSINTDVELDTDECLKEMDADDVRQWMQDNGHLNLSDLCEAFTLPDIIEELNRDNVLSEYTCTELLDSVWEQDDNIGAWAMAGEGGETRLTVILDQAIKANPEEARRQIGLSGVETATRSTLADLAKDAGGAANLLPALVAMIVAECRP